MNVEREYLVYCYTSPSGKRYIGQTKDYTERSRRKACRGYTK